MKPITKRNIQTRYGFTVDEVRYEHSPRSSRKFTLNATYPDGRKLRVWVWKREDVHTAIGKAIASEVYGIHARAKWRREGLPVSTNCEHINLWDAWAQKAGEQ